MRQLIPQIAFYCSLCGLSSASLVTDGPYSLHLQLELPHALHMPASVVYEYDETTFVLRTDRFPIKVFILSGTPSPNCLIPIGDMQEVHSIEEGEDVAENGLYSLALSPEAIHIVVYDRISRQTKLQSYSKDLFQKLHEKDVSGSGFSIATRIRSLDDSLLLPTSLYPLRHST